MPTYKITSTLAYQLEEPENIGSQTTKEFQKHVKLLHEGDAFSGPDAVQDIWLRMTPTEQGAVEQALFTMAFDKAFLLGLAPLMVVLNPEQTLERAIEEGFPLWNKKNDTAFVSLIAPAQHLACSLQPSAINGICNLFQHPQIAGHMSLDYCHEDEKLPVMAQFVTQSSKPVIIHRSHLQEPLNIFEYNETGPCKGFLRNLHAFCFADVVSAKSLGAHFAPDAGGSVYGAVACPEVASIAAGYNWRNRGILPLLPRKDQADFFVRMVKSHLGVARGKKVLGASITADPQAFRAALLQLTGEESEALLKEGVISAANLDNLNDAGRSAVLERDLGL
jgi:hypothetical protein